MGDVSIIMVIDDMSFIRFCVGTLIGVVLAHYTSHG